MSFRSITYLSANLIDPGTGVLVMELPSGMNYEHQVDPFHEYAVMNVARAEKLYQEMLPTLRSIECWMSPGFKLHISVDDVLNNGFALFTKNLSNKHLFSDEICCFEITCSMQNVLVMELHQEMSSTLRRMIERRIPLNLKSRIDADSVLQDAFIRLGKKLRTRFPVSEKLCRAWIIRSVLDEWHDQRRRHLAKRCTVIDEVRPPDGSGQFLLGGIGVHTDFVWKQTFELIHNLIRPAEFEIVWMRAVDELSYPEIAVITERTEEAVRKCYNRAIEKIKTAISSPFASSS